MLVRLSPASPLPSACLPVEISLIAVPGAAAPLELPERRTGAAPVSRVVLQDPGPDGLPDAAGLAAAAPAAPLRHSAVPGSFWN